MASTDKIKQALTSAASYLESAESALSREDEGSFEEDIWHVGAELEYALFLFKIMIHPVREGPRRARARANLRKAEAEIGRTVSEANSLLKYAAGSVRRGELLEAFKNASSARDQVLIIQKYLEKKRRQALKYR